jgi:hypothetical protein
MPTGEARIRSNQNNAQMSTDPRTEAGKMRSRSNAVKHGLTGEGIALPAEDAAEVDRLARSFEAELKPSGDVGRTLVRRMALAAVRMDRSADQELASLTERVRQVDAEFDAEWPAVEGEVDPDRERLRAEAARRAMFDPSKPACLARKYEASAERCFFRSLKELRLVEKAARATGSRPTVGEARAALGSFLPAESIASVLESLPVATPARPPVIAPRGVAPASNSRPKPSPSLPSDLFTPIGGAFEVPFAIGRIG